jgi:hypothetical protein
VKANHIIIKAKICENKPYNNKCKICEKRRYWFVFTYFTFYYYMVCFHIFYLLLLHGLFSHILPFIFIWSVFTYFTFYYHIVCFHIFYLLLLYLLFSQTDHIIIKGKICENRPYDNKR